MNEPGYYHALGPDEALKQHFLDTTAIETMKISLADPQEQREQHETAEDFADSVAEFSYTMAHAMWRARNLEYTVEE